VGLSIYKEVAMRRVTALLGVTLVFNTYIAAEATGDVFGSGTDAFVIEFVTVGDPGNPADTTGDPSPAGSVPYTYRIGKYEISEQMIEKANALGGLGITKDERWPNKPATRISWFEAAYFVNWLNTSTGNAPAYKFAGGDIEFDIGFELWTPADAGYDPANPFRNRLAKYVLPNVDEWYKAAFYDPVTQTYFDFPTGSNSPPIATAGGTAPGTAVFDQPFEQGPADIMLAGGESPFGTVGQSANVYELEETDRDSENDDPLGVRGLRGGAWSHLSRNPSALSSSSRNWVAPWFPVGDVGFRVASTTVPEPVTVCLVLFAAWLIRW
jgi:hypothetical protein